MKLAALLLLLLPVCLGAEEEGFVPLFDGKTLDGWVNVNCPPTNSRPSCTPAAPRFLTHTFS